METFFGALVLLGICLTAMSLGVFFTGKKLQGSCGGVGADSSGKLQLEQGCGFCVKKEHDVCESSDENGDLVKIATLGSPGRGRHHHP